MAQQGRLIIGPGLWHVRLQYNKDVTKQLAMIAREYCDRILLQPSRVRYSATLFSVKQSRFIPLSLFEELFDAYQRIALYGVDPLADQIEYRACVLMRPCGGTLVGVTHVIPTWAALLRKTLIAEIGYARGCTTDSTHIEVEGVARIVAVLGVLNQPVGVGQVESFVRRISAPLKPCRVTFGAWREHRFETLLYRDV